MKPIFYAYLITVLVFSACSSGKSTFERGNYYEAVITSVNRLRKNSDHKKSVETLRMAYPMAVTFYEDRAKTAIASTQPFKWSEVVNSYTTINNMYDEIKRCPGALKVVPNPVNYFSQLQQARENAAEEHYAAGIVALQFKEREKAKQAYAFFKTANGFIPGYKEVISYMEAALNAATVKILVEPIPVHSRSVGVSAEFFNDKISEFVHSAPISEFVRFYTRAEAETMKLNPDHILQLQFDEFTVGQVYKHEKEIQLRKDSVVMATYVTPSTADQQNRDGGRTNATGKSGLAVSGTGIVASTQDPVVNNHVNAPNPVINNDDAERAAREKAEREKAEREAAEKEAASKALAAKEKADREAAEKAQAAANALAEKQKADREQAEKLKAEKEKAEREAAEKAQAAAQALAEKQKAEREQAEKLKAEKEKAEREAAEKAQAAAHALAEKQKAEREQAEKLKAEKEKAEREAAEKMKAEKEKAEREKAEKEKAAKDVAEKAKLSTAKDIDPTILSSDTLDVKDPVTICHIPPGNNMKRRTLVISRSALKAHLDHGDRQGDCEINNKNPGQQKGAPQQDDKGKQGGNKGKGPGADNRSLKAHSNAQARAFDGTADQLIIASAETDPSAFLRYREWEMVGADTNKVYGTVKATLYHNTKKTTAKGVVSFRIIDARTGALLSAEKMPGEFVWVSEWATFNGDERALSAEQLKLTTLKEQPAPAPQDLFIEFTRPIYDQMTTKIREFYKGY